MIRKLTILSTILFFALTASAKEETDTSFQTLYNTFYKLFNTGNVEEFYKVSQQIQDYYLAQGNLDAYYIMRQNEILYDAEHGMSYKAITKANKMLEDMKKSNIKRYERVYNALGAVFESRGNYRMAVHYYQEALDNVSPKDSATVGYLCSQLTAANITINPDKAAEWNERLAKMSAPNSYNYKSYLAFKTQIYFFKGEKENYFKARQEFEDFIIINKDNTAVNANKNGEHVLKVMTAAFNGNYDKALELLKQDSQDYDELKSCDIRTKIYLMMGNSDLALQEANKRRDVRDSLNSDLLFNNINEINTAAGIVKLNEKAAKEREMWMGTVIVLLFVALGLIISRYLIHRRYQARILKQNEQLEIALDEAQESERMKNIFIQHISHEIRTPLNVITGYAQVITNPLFELEADERNKMLQAIGQNTVAITDIVNDLLEISQEESKERYRKDDRITVNEFCRHIMEEEEEKNKGRLELKFKTSVADDYIIQSNRVGIDRILRQVLSNALKFTEKGQVELSVYKSDNNNLQFAVTDTGVGIPEEEYEHVFEQFYKVDSFKQGLGIGLSISYKIAILLGGDLAIDKTYHDGTRMILTIPIK